MYEEYIKTYLQGARQIIDQIDQAAIAAMIGVLVKVREDRGRLFILGVSKPPAAEPASATPYLGTRQSGPPDCPTSKDLQQVHVNPCDRPVQSECDCVIFAVKRPHVGQQMRKTCFDVPSALLRNRSLGAVLTADHARRRVDLKALVRKVHFCPLLWGRMVRNISYGAVKRNRFLRTMAPRPLAPGAALKLPTKTPAMDKDKSPN